MEQNNVNNISLIDASKIIVEACYHSGADVFIGYPITPTNLVYRYSFERFPIALSAPDEITTIQWMSGFSATGKFPVTATSFPGLALMIESINMAFMMELPLLIILAQRLGPSTGSATTGAQGDLLFLRGAVSGGYHIPVFCPSNFYDCWDLTNQSIHTAIELRTPVILLSSKEMLMTSRSFDLSKLPSLSPSKLKLYNNSETYMPYSTNESQVPDFLPIGDDIHQVRFNASTHDSSGLIKKASKDAMDNTRRLHDKIIKGMAKYNFYELDDQGESDILIVTYGISSDATKDAVKQLRSLGEKVSCLVVKTLLPVSAKIKDIIEKYSRVIFVEENLTGLFRELIYGQFNSPNHVGVNKIAEMIKPNEIIKVVQLDS